ncbi:MAG: hypothetical protein R3C25_06925 [Hyphomonadaceae bacterium]
MANSILRSFVTGTRAMLTAQLFVSVGAVGLAGWTLGVTNDLIRERDRLQERVIQLEQAMAARGDIPPEAAPVVEAPAASGAQVPYPDSIEGAVAPSPETNEPAPGGGDASVETQPAAEEPAPAAPPQRTPEQPDQPAPQATRPGASDLGAVLGSLFAPPPPLRTVVLHVRAEGDRAMAQRIARELMAAGQVRVLIDVMPPRDPRQSGYAYFDGRQSRPAAEIVARFHDASRRYEIAPWSAQLRGVALPAQGEYTADRLDIVLPPLPAEPVRPPIDSLTRVPGQ